MHADRNRDLPLGQCLITTPGVKLLSESLSQRCRNPLPTATDPLSCRNDKEGEPCYVLSNSLLSQPY
jgi:hypothetical protein